MSDNAGNRAVDAQRILRSINVTLDNATPERIAHFCPTAKSTRLLRSWLLPGHSSSYFVVAPYGTGKSLTAAFFIQAVENLEESRDVLGRITERFTSVDADLAEALESRVQPRQASLFAQHGATVVLSGFQPNVPEAIKAALLGSLKRTGNREAAKLVSRRRVTSMDTAIALLSKIRERFCPDPIDRLAIVWDEFGRHLEELVVRGSSASLADVQTLAEFCARTRRVPTTFALLLHQGLSRYATNTSVTVQREWKKIEGRFETIQFVDDSKELYQLIGQIMRQIRSNGPPPRKVLDRGLRTCQDVGLFGDFSTEDTEQLLSDSYPLEPITLYLLPRVSSRVAQNERTLFTFLYSLVTTASTSGPVTPDALYDYFSDAMRSDSLPGGSYHTWLETESALHKVNSAIDQRTLKCACLLGLGLVGERSRVSRRLLECAVSGYGAAKAARDSVRRLIASNLLLYRRNADNVSIWHGTDLDLRGRLDQEKDRIGPRFDHVAFLTSEAPPSPWKSVGYNVEYGTERYFESRYIAAHTILMNDQVEGVLSSASTADGMLYVVVPESDEELQEVRKHLGRLTLGPSVVVAVPRQANQLAESALDVYALHLLRQDTSLLAEDPLVEPELVQMIDDAQGYLNLHLNRMFHPSAEGPEYRWGDQYRVLVSPKELRQFLSSIMREVYPLTPRIKNEMIVRRRPRPAIVNSRKKLILGILERSGTENLGLEGYRPDMSMFRTVLLLTGLYRSDRPQLRFHGRSWRYALPEEIPDKGLSEVWMHISDFFTSPSAFPKHLAELVERLCEPPYGVRLGILPILLAAALRAFPTPLTITLLDGTYVCDLLPSTVEAIVASPNDYLVLVPDLTPSERRFLDRVIALFDPDNQTSCELDTLRRCYDAIVRWQGSLPTLAFASRHLSQQAHVFAKHILDGFEPYQFLFRITRDMIDASPTSENAHFSLLEDCKSELEGVVHSHYGAAGRVVRSVFDDHSAADDDIRTRLHNWARLLPPGIRNTLSDGTARALIAQAGMNHASDDTLLDRMSALLVGKLINRWDDHSVVAFERKLIATRRDVEDAVLNLATMCGGVPNTSVVRIATARLDHALRVLLNATDETTARAIVRHSIAQLNGGTRNGTIKSSA